MADSYEEIIQRITTKERDGNKKISCTIIFIL